MEAYNKKTLDYEEFLDISKNMDRVEFINGVLYDMAPSPNYKHQSIVGTLFLKIGNYINNKNGKCKPFVAPFDVKLQKNDERGNELINIVQPDVFVVCDKDKLKTNFCLGAPDFVAEIISPATKSKDYFIKAELYEAFGVREYWIINPITNKVTIYRLKENTFMEPEVIDFGENIKIEIFEDLAIDTSEFIEV